MVSLSRAFAQSLKNLGSSPSLFCRPFFVFSAVKAMRCLP